MRFKFLFVAFNVVLLVSFLLVFFMPALVLGWDYAGVFWSDNWPVGLIFLLMLAGLNAYFAMNWRVFSLLELEDWAAVVSHLDERMRERGKISRNRARVLINALVVSGNVARITEVEAFLREHQPGLIPKLSMELAVPHLLSQDAERTQRYFGELVDDRRANDPYWVRWGLAFSLMSQSRFDDARAELSRIVTEFDDPILQPLAARMLDQFSGQDESVARQVADARDSLRKKYSRERMARELERQRQNLQVLFLASRIEEAQRWVHAG